MRTLIFDTQLTGHHPEYLHNLYIGAIEHPSREYVFAIPSDGWDKIRGLYDWPHADNVQFYFLSKSQCERLGHGSQIQKCYRTSKLIRNVVLETQSQKVFLIVLASSIPFLPFLIPAKTRIRGIIYQIFLRSSTISRLKRVMDYVRYFVMAHSKSIDKVFILNDESSTQRLNQKFHTTKFTFLADPVPSLGTYVPKYVRNELGITHGDKVYLHFGAMERRKGTMVIMEAISEMSPEELRDKVFIFAGVINASIASEFNQLREKALQSGARIIVKNYFLPAEDLYDLCYSSDCILAPYLLTNLSSGVIGYGALFGKPIIGPESGLIGELISNNKLGVAMDIISPTTLKDQLQKPFPAISDEYAIQNTLQRFVDSILKND